MFWRVRIQHLFLRNFIFRDLLFAFSFIFAFLTILFIFYFYISRYINIYLQLLSELILALTCCLLSLGSLPSLDKPNVAWLNSCLATFSVSFSLMLNYRSVFSRRFFIQNSLNWFFGQLF